MNSWPGQLCATKSEKYQKARIGLIEVLQESSFWKLIAKIYETLTYTLQRHECDGYSMLFNRITRCPPEVTPFPYIQPHPQEGN